MTLRIVELFRLGAFRLAVRPGLLGANWPEGFAVLESAVNQLANHIATIPYERLVPPRQEYFPERPGPRLGDREGFVDGMVSKPAADGTVRLLVRGFFNMKGWPLGHWVVWTGYWLSPTHSPAPLSEAELGEIW